MNTIYGTAHRVSVLNGVACLIVMQRITNENVGFLSSLQCRWLGWYWLLLTCQLVIRNVNWLIIYKIKFYNRANKFVCNREWKTYSCNIRYRFFPISAIVNLYFVLIVWREVNISVKYINKKIRIFWKENYIFTCRMDVNQRLSKIVPSVNEEANLIIRNISFNNNREK